MFILLAVLEVTPPTCTIKTCLFVRVPPVPLRRGETTRLCICPICLNKSLPPFGINLIFPARPCFCQRLSKKKALDHTRHCCSHIKKDPKKIQKIPKRSQKDPNTGFDQCKHKHHRDPCLFTVLPLRRPPTCTMHVTIVPFFRQCLGHRQLFQGILQQRLVFRHLFRAPFAPDQHFSHLVQQFGVFSFCHGRGHFCRRSRLHGFVVPRKRT
jgi:hypothetical protein